MNWNDLTANPEVLYGYFAAEPSRQLVEVLRFVLDGKPSTIDIVFKPPAFPVRERGKEPSDASSTEVTLRLSDISSLVFNGWTGNMLGRLIIVRRPNTTAVTFVGDVIFEAECSCIQVTKVHGYVEA